MSLNNLSATNMSDALIDAGDFVINKRLVSNNQILYYTDPVTSIKTGYVWKGTLPHITSTNNPNTDGGISDTAWVPVIYSKLKEKMETEGLTLDWNAHLPTVEVAYGLTKNSLKMWKSGTTATSDDYWLYTDGTVWNGVGVLGSTPETSTGFEKITPNFNASIKTYSASATDGQTVFNIPFTFSTITVFVNGSIKLPGLNYTVSGNTVTFTTELEAGDLLYVFIGNPNISTNDKLNRIYTANAMQGQTQIQVPYSFSTALLYINGVLQNPSSSYSIGADNVITLAESLYQDDEIVVMCGDVIISSDDYVLKTELNKPTAASNIGIFPSGNVQNAITYITPEMFGAKGDGVTDDSDSIITAIQNAITRKLNIKLQNQYRISKQLTVPNDISITGSGVSTGFIFNQTPTSQLRMLYVNSKNVLLKDFSINFKTAGLGTIDNIMLYGIFVDSASENCLIDNITINGKYNETTMGFSNGIRITGKHNTVTNCSIENCSMGMTGRGEDLTISFNYCNNHFVDNNYTIWNNTLPYWDGLAFEGLIKSKIIGNTCEYNGQSGIYFGGGATLSLSYDNIVMGNRSYFNANHGIDMGVGTVTATADLYSFTVTGNISRNNRYNQIWMGSVHHITVSGNQCIMDDEYNQKFGITGDSSGIALRQTTNNCTINGNTIKVTSSQYASLYVRGTNHTVSGNTIEGKDMVLENVLSSNNLYLSGKFTPTLSTVSTSNIGISITNAAGYYEVKGNKITYYIDVTLSGTTPSGPLVFSSPIFSGSTIVQYDAKCTFDSGLTSNFYTNKYGINVYYSTSGITVAIKDSNGNAIDAGAFISSSTRLRLNIEGIISNPSWIGYYN